MHIEEGGGRQATRLQIQGCTEPRSRLLFGQPLCSTQKRKGP